MTQIMYYTQDMIKSQVVAEKLFNEIESAIGTDDITYDCENQRTRERYKKVLYPMGAFLSLEFVKTFVEIVVLCVSYLPGVLLPDQYGASVFLPKVKDELTILNSEQNFRRQDFPGSGSSFSGPERCQWMAKIQTERSIGQILWPGTHHSATSEIGFPYITRPLSQRQTMSIHHQLLNGVRALDIRVQQDRLVCNGRNLSDTTIDNVITNIRTFLSSTKSEIIILEIRTERGYLDPKDFEAYLVRELDELLIHQDEKVFSKSISEVLPRKIICIWKPIINASRPKQGGPIWSGKYIKSDEFDIELPLTRFDGNINNLKSRSEALKTYNFFYKVENTLNPQTSTLLESLMVWPKYADVVSRRINGFARLFLAKCHDDGILDRLQVFSTDFVTDDFISACIGINYAAISKKESSLLETTSEESDNLNMINNSNSSNNVNATRDNSTNENDNEHISIQESRLLEVTSEVSDNMNMINNSNSSNDVNATRDNSSNENDNTCVSITWAKYVCIWLRPKSLKIIHRGDEKSLKWITHWWGRFEAAHFLEVYSLNLSGEYNVENLQQGTRYEVLFWVQMLDSAFGWESPLHLRLILPDGSIQENHPVLDMTPRKLLYIPAGNFVMSPEMVTGQIKYSLEQHETKVLKGGIAIFGVYIQRSFTDILIARDLSIMFHDVDECWRWLTVPYRYTKRDIEVAKMISVEHFKVHGVFETGKLLVGCTYKVGFQIFLSSTSTGWESPTEISLRLPNGASQRRRGCFKDMPKDEDVCVHVGEFKMSSDLVGKVEFSMDNDNKVHKSGISVMLAFIEEQH